MPDMSGVNPDLQTNPTRTALAMNEIHRQRQNYSPAKSMPWRERC
jgi:hypothetical protein